MSSRSSTRTSDLLGVQQNAVVSSGSRVNRFTNGSGNEKYISPGSLQYSRFGEIESVSSDVFDSIVNSIEVRVGSRKKAEEIALLLIDASKLDGNDPMVTVDDIMKHGGISDSIRDTMNIFRNASQKEERVSKIKNSKSILRRELRP